MRVYPKAFVKNKNCNSITQILKYMNSKQNSTMMMSAPFTQRSTNLQMGYQTQRKNQCSHQITLPTNSLDYNSITQISNKPSKKNSLQQNIKQSKLKTHQKKNHQFTEKNIDLQRIIQAKMMNLMKEQFLPILKDKIDSLNLQKSIIAKKLFELQQKVQKYSIQLVEMEHRMPKVIETITTFMENFPSNLKCHQKNKQLEQKLKNISIMIEENRKQCKQQFQNLPIIEIKKKKIYPKQQEDDVYQKLATSHIRLKQAIKISKLSSSIIQPDAPQILDNINSSTKYGKISDEDSGADVIESSCSCQNQQASCLINQMDQILLVYNDNFIHLDAHMQEITLRINQLTSMHNNHIPNSDI